jgi:hypothetical protein
MSRWIYPDQPWGLIRSLVQCRERLRQRLEKKAPSHPKYQELNKRIVSEREPLRAALLIDIQEKYEREGPV